MDELPAACWEETLNAGRNDFGDKPIDCGVVLQGDRRYALLHIRTLTYGPTYAFAINCQSEACRARIESELDLAELQCWSQSESVRAARREPLRDHAARCGQAGLVSAPHRCRMNASSSSSGLTLPTSSCRQMIAFQVLEVEAVELPRYRPALRAHR